MLILEVKRLTTLIEKIVGLIGQDTISPIYFKTRFGIHTFGVKHPIDVLILSQNFTVMKIAQNLKPNRVFLWSPIYENVIELPLGIKKQKNIKIGMKVKLLDIN